MNFDTKEAQAVENDNHIYGSFSRQLRTHARIGDVLVFSFVPVILGVVYSWPSELRQSLVFEYTDPSLLTAFTANFVHLRACPRIGLANQLVYETSSQLKG